MEWVDIVTRKQNILLIYTKVYGWSEAMRGVLGVGHNNMMMVSRQEATTYYVDKFELARLLKILKNKLLKDKSDMRRLAQDGMKRFHIVIDYLKTVTAKDLDKCSNEKLASYFQHYFQQQVHALPYLILPNFVDDIFVEEMERYLKKILRGSAERETMSECLNAFTVLEEESYATKTDRELLEIALLLANEKDIVKSKDVKEFTVAIKKREDAGQKIIDHTKKWSWLPIQAEEEPYDINFLLKSCTPCFNPQLKSPQNFQYLMIVLKRLRLRKTILLKPLISIRDINVL